MSDKKGRPRTDIPWMSPYLTVADVTAAADFYNQAFGFQVNNIVNDEQGTPVHGELTYEGQLLMIGKESAYGSTTQTPAHSATECPMNLYLYCADVDTHYHHAISQGATSLSAPEDTFWGDRMCSVKCPDGYMWCFATSINEEKTV